MACVVIYLDRETLHADRGGFNFRGDLELDFCCRYKVIKLWEVDPGPVLAMESPGLCPFVPLMSGNPEELIAKPKEKIISAPELIASAEDKRTLLATMSALASRVFEDRKRLDRMLAEIRKMGDNCIIDKLFEEGRAVSLEEGRDQGIRSATV